MYKTEIFLRNVNMTGILTDSRNRIGGNCPVIPLGVGAELILTLFKNSSGTTVFTAEELDFASWEFSINSSYGSPATVKLLKTSGITVGSNGTVHIALASTSTQELVASLGSERQKNMTCELCGCKSGETVPSFLLQWDVIIRNRIGGSGSGTPAPAEDGTLSSAQIQALIAALPSPPVITDLTTASLTPLHGRIYRKTAAEGDSFTFSSQNLDQGHTADFELRIRMPSSAVTVTFGTGIRWISGTAPQMTEGGAEYVFRFRWDGSRFLGKQLYCLTA